MTVQDIPFIRELAVCTEVHEIDAYFDSVGFDSSIVKRTQFLLDYMGIIGTSDFGDISEESRYGMAKELFVSDRWKYIN